MLRILRKIKPGKPAGENSGSFWRFAIAESVLIFLGILIALQVDNWNQDRKDRKLERVLLTEMHNNLKGDLEDIKYNVITQQRLLNSNQVALDFLKSELPWNDSLGWHFTQLMGAGIFDFNASAFESLKTIGIDLISNDSLRQSITGHYTVIYTHVKANENMLFDFLFDNLYPSLSENLRTAIPRELAVPVNLVELRQNNVFLEDLNMTIFIYNLSLQTNRRASMAIRALIEDLEIELGLDTGAPN